jgi:hypothetical protein
VEALIDLAASAVRAVALSFAAFGLFLLLIVLGLAYALVVRDYWNWFVSPLGLPSIGVAHAYGLVSLVWLLQGPSLSQGHEDANDSAPVALMKLLVKLALSWVLGWLIFTFAGPFWLTLRQRHCSGQLLRNKGEAIMSKAPVAEWTKARAEAMGAAMERIFLNAEGRAIQEGKPFEDALGVGIAAGCECIASQVNTLIHYYSQVCQRADPDTYGGSSHYDFLAEILEDIRRRALAGNLSPRRALPNVTG